MESIKLDCTDGRRDRLGVFRLPILYAPELGRWLTRDPLGEAGGLNLYAYVGNNPVNWVDPWGLYVDNNSPHTVYFKPAGKNDYPQTILNPSGAGAEPIAPHSCSLEAYQDGVAVPFSPDHPREVLKTVNGVNVTVNPDSTVSLDHGWSPLTWIAQKIRGGWVNRQWQDKKKATDWEDIFNAAEGQ